MEFLKKLKKGNQEAYNYLVDIYHHELCVYAGSLSRDIHTAEDIVQNVFLKLWEQREKLNSKFSIKGFLYRSVYNEFIDQYRKKMALTVVEEYYNSRLNTITEEEDTTEIANLITLVKQEIQHLPPKCKEMFLLSKQEGLTNVEIAQYLKVSIKAVERQMTRAFSIIRKKVGEKMHTILFLLFGMHPKQNQLISKHNILKQSFTSSNSFLKS
ncbi:RNA polymerase sigma factor [Flavivirga spongiicola]|uniref:RNA polymerase sigma-70 factor n=1 Tax=Flavivirga spongiicola TaxID=421621 RepID=A0ABU7XNW3_9FLAO|nr:RNA polymerase sigma-70 factor [Flavivirga sp. MEBiC05379]MDO5977469.1 RNA polymerase sigma-70 factor [Flavivirga sp. MEBiC05379]